MMKRYFLLILCFLIGINLCIKSYIYFTSEKIEGKVTELEKYVTYHHGRKGSVSYEESISPVVVYQYKGATYQNSKSEWGRINLLDINDKVTLLLSDEGKTVKINTLFQFWFTLYDMFAGFCICFVGTIILGTLLPDKKEKVEEWK